MKTIHTPDTISDEIIEKFHGKLLTGLSATVIKDGTLRTITLQEPLYFTAYALWIRRMGHEFKVVKIFNRQGGEVVYERNFSEFGEAYLC